MDRDRLLGGLKRVARMGLDVGISVASGGPPATSRSASYLFDGRGIWVAYLDETGNVYDARTNALLGYVPVAGPHIAAPNGDYLCSIVDDRLFRAVVAPWRSFGSAPSLVPGIPPRPITTMRPPQPPPPGYEAFELH